MNSLLSSLFDQNLTSFQAAEELETSLLEQKGYLTYYFLDGNPDWLKQMEQHQQAFTDSLQKARRSAYTEAMQDVIRQIDAGYQAYAKSRQEVIELCHRGERQAWARRHGEARRQFAGLLNLCERYKLMHEYAISRARTESEAQARLLNTFALVALPGVTILGALLAYILIRQILGPIRQLALETAPANPGSVPGEVKALSRRVHSLMENVDQAQRELERSQ
jgi:CHASE3 domain sensor protein